MKEYLVLDGYNVLNGWPKLKELCQGDLDGARKELLEMMAEYGSFKGIEVIVVFDAHLVKGSMQKNEKLKGVEVVFTKEKQTADSYIERLITELSIRNRVVVATNDWAEQQMVLGGGATRISVRELVLEFQNIKVKIKKKGEKLSQERNDISSRLDETILEKLEKFRRGS
ncbi:protein of unknown function DUF901 [Alkaliphilus metalliredigens QYMF]|uniref:NYN domain-containing protein n=1 Tax=Alkaliphilus metalliredigens (strain QYMF) TaxID=293826 RepID=A6TWK0_ALKMQ|nr:NYN domain-containing protein [Alkaliphilus metalliredigens]ABR50568.1 protein of unknown function DUF901 [Alkaliphilus metalliredigens QYMF]